MADQMSTVCVFRSPDSHPPRVHLWGPAQKRMMYILSSVWFGFLCKLAKHSSNLPRSPNTKKNPGWEYFMRLKNNPKYGDSGSYGKIMNNLLQSMSKFSSFDPMHIDKINKSYYKFSHKKLVPNIQQDHGSTNDSDAYVDVLEAQPYCICTSM